MKCLVSNDSAVGWNVDSYFMVVDVSDPLNMSVINRVKLAGDCGAYLHDSARLYCLEREFFEVFDVSDIESIRALKRIEGYTGGRLLLDEKSDLLYLSNWRHGIAIFDLSNRDDPIPLGSADCDCIDPPPVGNDGPYGIANGLCLRGDYLFGVSMDYVMSRNMGALYVYDVSDPLNPRKVTRVPTHNFRAHGVCSKSNYVFTVGAYGVLTFDISTPEDPMVIGELTTVNRFYASAEVVDNLMLAVGVVHGSRERNGVLDIIDVSNPVHPQISGEIVLPLNIVLNVKTIGSLSYIASNSGVATVDITEPGSPRLLSCLDSAEGRSNWGIEILEVP